MPCQRRQDDTPQYYDGEMYSPAGPGDEPSLAGEEWVEWGGELTWAVDFTSGGAPIGLTERQFRQINAQYEAGAGWAPETEPAREWATEHLPPDRPAVLVHGDLLGQNIFVYPDQLPTVIDWEFCRMGDPAYDLAVITRGVRRPFQMERGLDRLLQAYAAAGGEPPIACHKGPVDCYTKRAAT